MPPCGTAPFGRSTGATGPAGTAGVQADTVATSASTSTSTYGPLTGSAGPTITLTVPATGRVLIEVTSGMNGNNNGSCFMSFAMSGANTAAATDANAVTLASNNVQRASSSSILTGLTPGSTTFTAQYKAGSSVTCTFANRALWGIPLT